LLLRASVEKGALIANCESPQHTCTFDWHFIQLDVDYRLWRRVGNTGDIEFRAYHASAKILRATDFLNEYRDHHAGFGIDPS
jgi:hypothetical protein